MKRRALSIIISAIIACFTAIGQVNTDQVLRVGQNALYFEDYILSIQYFNQVIQAKPYLAQPYLYRAIAKLNLDDYLGAEADASTAIRLNEFLTDAWEVRGVARQNYDNNYGAIADYDHALQLLPRNRQILFNKAIAQSNLAKEDERMAARADSTYSELLRYYPGYDNGYLGRAKLRLEQGDTIGASSDINRALDINRNAVNGYILRANIALSRGDSLKNALADMNEAIKLEPKLAGLYINRAYMRYMLNDYFGAMADYDYSLELEPYNQVALFNRGLLLMEVADYDRALNDYTKLLTVDPDDYRSLYNRAVIFGEKRMYDEAIADVNKVIERFYDFPSAYYMRSEFYREKGDLRRAQADYNRAVSLSKTVVWTEDSEPETVPEDMESAAKRFATLLTIDNDTDLKEEYNNQAIRGKVQNRDIAIEIEPLIELSYYTSPSEITNSTYYMQQVDEINSSRILRFIIALTSRPPQLTDEDLIKRHFSSIEYYNSYISTHTPRSIDYIGRALDFITLKNYAAAIEDLNKAIALTPDHAVAYMLRAQARYHQLSVPSTDENIKPLDHSILLQAVLDDYDRAIELAPRSAVAWFDKGNILFEMGDLTSALASYNKAIDLKADMGEAYYNRGYIYLKLGNQNSGIDDLSKAGELGIISAYNLIKKLTR